MSVLKGLRLERAQGSKQFAGGLFRNTSGVTPGLKGNPLPIVGEFFFGGRARLPRAPLPVESPLLTWATPVSSSGLRITWLGHSTMLLEIDGVRVLTDPVFGQRASPFSFIVRLTSRSAYMSFHDFSATTIDGRDQALSAYKGQVVLVVNTASACGFTPQYAGLEKLWQEYRNRGVAVVGFPSNDFGAQEPGSEAEIQAFCTRNFGVTFPLYSKVKTKGAGQSPIYAFLSKKDGAPQWNFHKYLVGKDGEVLAAFASSVSPEDKKLRAAIDAALG